MKQSVRTPAGADGTGLPSLRAALCRAWSARAPAGAIGCVLLILSPVAGLHAQERLGRLFSSPEQRLELDRLRDDPDFGKTPEPVAAAIDPLPGSRLGQGAPATRIDGAVFRGGAHRVLWINGVMAGAGAAAPGGIRIDADGASGGQIRLRLPGGRSTVALKPGQAIDGAHRRVLEAYERRPANDAAPASGKRFDAEPAPLQPPRATPPRTTPDGPFRPGARVFRRGPGAAVRRTRPAGAQRSRRAPERLRSRGAIPA